MLECHACGAEIDPRDKFCSKCGELTERGRGISELAGRYVAQLADGFGKLFAAALNFLTNPANRKNVAIGAVVAFLLLTSLTNNPISRGIGSLLEQSPYAPAFHDEGTPDFAAYEDVFIGDEMEYYVVGLANIRDFPTSQNTNVIGSLAEGNRVLAREVMAFDPDSRWLKLSDGGYVWGRNLVSVSNGENVAGLAVSPALTGRWTNGNACAGLGQSTFVSVSETDVIVDGTRYAILNVLTAGQELPAYEFSTAGSGVSEDAYLQLTEDPNWDVLWITYPYDAERGELRLFRADLPCPEVMRLAERMTSR